MRGVGRDFPQDPLYCRRNVGLVLDGWKGS